MSGKDLRIVHALPCGKLVGLARHGPPGAEWMIRTTSIELVEPDRIQWFGPNNPAPQFKHPVLPFAPMRLEGYVQLICVCGPLDDLVDVRDILDALRRGDPRIFVPVRSDNP